LLHDSIGEKQTNIVIKIVNASVFAPGCRLGVVLHERCRYRWHFVGMRTRDA
jgi:hypothetical protein